MFTLGWAFQNKLPFEFVSVVYLPQSEPRTTDVLYLLRVIVFH